MTYPVTINWHSRPSMSKWNEICAWAVDHFGLPGDRYKTEIDENQMTWAFVDKEDQLLMILAWGNDEPNI